MRIGVDTGGTFTDCVVLTRGRIKVLKVFSTPADASRAIVEGVRKLAQIESPAASRTPEAPSQKATRPPRWSLEVIHGTTVGTNCLLERRGARVALVTTAGFEDLLEIGRQARPQLYDFNVQREPPLVPRGRRFGVKERIAADGAVLQSISNAEIQRAVRRVQMSGAESVAVCFLFSFANPAHERQVAAALRKLGLPLSISHEILPEFREFERLSTVVINAYLSPRMGTYLRNLERGVQALALSRGGKAGGPNFDPQSKPSGAGRVYVMQSNGGISTAARAGGQPVRTILSGPAGGVVASAWLAQQLGLDRAISFDMGGTSTDVCLLDGAPRTTHETLLAGLPVAVPVLDVHSVGAGGGSLARLDAGGALRVGPASAGAQPGPVCYGRGGTGLTVTDANLILGRLDADNFLGGTFRLDAQAARRAFEASLAGPGHRAGFNSAEELAAGIISVSNATMEKALRVISVERGYDPRDFSLICYGGAGGLHAADLARALDLPAVIVPQNPGAFSAMGILLSDVVRDVSQSVLMPVPAMRESILAADCPDWRRFAGHKARSGTRSGIISAAQLRAALRRLTGEIDHRFAALHRQALAGLRAEGFSTAQARAERRIDARYQGQSYELSIPFTARFREGFTRAHTQAYGHADSARPLEIVNLRLRVVIPTPKARAQTRNPIRRTDIRQALIKTKPVWFEGRPHPTGIYNRERLSPGARLRGPAVITEYSATTIVPPDFTCSVDPSRNLVLRRTSVPRFQATLPMSGTAL